MSPAALTRRLLLSMLLLVALLGVVEIWLRVRDSESRSGFRFRRMSPAVAEDREGRYESHFARFWTLAPHFRHSPTHLGRDATGDWPFRGRPPGPSPSGLLRVAVVGDSVVYGTSLDAADIPGSRIQDALARRGWTPDRVAVISLGVPGYSTLQLGLLLQEQLGRLGPDAVVLWPAAWNDQAPAMIASDKKLLTERGEHLLREWARDHSRLIDALFAQRDPLPLDQIIAGWNRGVPPNGFRVSGGDVLLWITFALEYCDVLRVPAVVLASAHPPQTAADHPRTRKDAQTVIKVATRAGVPLVDAQALLDAAGLEPSRAFVDYVHPSAETNALLGDALAEALTPLLEMRAADRAARGEVALISPSSLSIVDVQPRQVPVLGDTPLRVTLSGWSRGDPLPAVIVGGAPLIDLRATGEHEVEGTLMANAAGRHALVVQSATGCAWQPEAIEYLDPAVTLETPPGQPPRLTVAARPGDTVRVLVAAGLAPAPQWSPRGAFWLDASARALPGDREADAQGLATWSFDQLPPGTFLIQALIAPAGEAPDAGLGSRWTAVVELSAAASTTPALPPASSPDAR